jgi:hypothetical protein
MKRTNKILVVLVTVSVLLLSNTIGVLALQSFTDVTDGHWAKDYVEKMAKKGIVTGYDDATFRPSVNVSKLQTIVMIFRAVKAADKLDGVDLDSMVFKNSMVLTQYNIPSWARQAVAYALENDIIKSYDLRSFSKSDGTSENAKRIEVSVYIGKALNKYLKEDLNQNIISLGFKDKAFISVADAKYVDLLVRKGIVEGDENGNFNPNKPIMRAAAAKMLSLSYDILDDLEVKVEPEKELTTKEGKIVLVVDDNDSIVVENSNGDKNIYKFHEDANIVIDGKNSRFSNLEEKENIKVYLDEDGVVVKAEVDITLSDSEGEVYSVVKMEGYYLLTIRDKENTSRKRTYKIDSDTVVKLNDITAKPTELEKGDSISIVAEGDFIKQISAQSKTRVYEGILETGIYFSGVPKIKIKAATQKIYELEVDEDAEVRKNNRKKSLMSLVKGDIVTITTEHDKVVKIVSTSIEEDDEGVITEIILGAVNKITILNDDGEEKTYALSPDVDIDIDDDRNVEISELKIDYRVELDIESDVVTDIDAERVETSNSLSGIITKVHDDFEAITIKVTENSEIKSYTVSVDNARIMSKNGSSRTFKDLDEDDEVFIYGENKNEIFDFVADRIFIMKEN